MSSMMGSSKYEFEPEQFDIDVREKQRVIQLFKKDLEEVLYGDYRYKDRQPLSESAKREILLEVHKEFIGGNNG